ncbi:hypothetical protein CALCODRAFT_510530 [Calocera cornea HHB12733]|uniref:Uncharacterized protein n=1 Tax=Calocera cornea HHB12733 TaxID=1353952 RepID=A0A165EG27_9BASI|nr:hypothetical protein CALCODRAFT_510530 [Calocera cornea HHB12733]
MSPGYDNGGWDGMNLLGEWIDVQNGDHAGQSSIRQTGTQDQDASDGGWGIAANSGGWNSEEQLHPSPSDAGIGSQRESQRLPQPAQQLVEPEEPHGEVAAKRNQPVKPIGRPQLNHGGAVEPLTTVNQMPLLERKSVDTFEVAGPVEIVQPQEGTGHVVRDREMSSRPTQSLLDEQPPPVATQPIGGLTDDNLPTETDAGPPNSEAQSQSETTPPRKRMKTSIASRTRSKSGKSNSSQHMADEVQRGRKMEESDDGEGSSNSEDVDPSKPVRKTSGLRKRSRKPERGEHSYGRVAPLLRIGDPNKSDKYEVQSEHSVELSSESELSDWPSVDPVESTDNEEEEWESTCIDNSEEEMTMAEDVEQEEHQWKYRKIWEDPDRVDEEYYNTGNFKNREWWALTNKGLPDYNPRTRKIRGRKLVPKYYVWWKLSRQRIRRAGSVATRWPHERRVLMSGLPEPVAENEERTFALSTI